MLAISSLCQSGDEIVSSATLYGGTYTQFDTTFRRFGYNTIFVDPDDLDNFRKAITDKTKLVYVETVANPRMNVIDIEGVARIAHEAGIPLMIDNTFATPYLCRPIEFGADIVLHSATKFIGGHGTSIGGVIVDSASSTGRTASSRCSPSPVLAITAWFSPRLSGRWPTSSSVAWKACAISAPACRRKNAFLFLQGLETLALRMEKHCANSIQLAKHLEEHDLVTWVKHADLPSSPYRSLARKYLPDGQGAIFTFGIKGGREAGRKFIDALEVFSHLANVGDAKSLVIHPATTTHQQLSESDQAAAGITPDMVRLSVGIEDIEDLIWDIDRALAASQA